jgi:hypothetical protein
MYLFHRSQIIGGISIAARTGRVLSLCLQATHLPWITNQTMECQLSETYTLPILKQHYQAPILKLELKLSQVALFE